MAISVSIETLDDDKEFGGPWSVDKPEHCTHSFVQEMNTNGGVFLGTDIFIPIGRIISLYFDVIDEDEPTDEVLVH